MMVNVWLREMALIKAIFLAFNFERSVLSDSFYKVLAPPPIFVFMHNMIGSTQLIQAGSPGSSERVFNAPRGDQNTVVSNEVRSR